MGQQERVKAAQRNRNRLRSLFPVPLLPWSRLGQLLATAVSKLHLEFLHPGRLGCWASPPLGRVAEQVAEQDRRQDGFIGKGGNYRGSYIIDGMAANCFAHARQDAQRSGFSHPAGITGSRHLLPGAENVNAHRHGAGLLGSLRCQSHRHANR